MSRSTQLPRYSPRLCRLFLRYLQRYFARNFDAVRTSRLGSVPSTSPRPLIVYANHPSWWDPIHFLLLAHFELPGVRIYGPMDADALEKYRFFKRLGAFGLERSPRGVATFLRTSLAVLAEPRSSLWITAQGQFQDTRRRPVRILPGLAHLARRLDEATVVPLAAEYPFWNERCPEALTLFGEPIEIGGEPRRSVEQWTELFEQKLTETMDVLAAEAQSRDPQRFRTLVRGRADVGWVYDGWRRLRAAAQGRSFSAAHGDER